jgi:flagellar basal body P-ring protein FlgI
MRNSLIVGWVIALIVVGSGCDQTETTEAPAPPPPTYSGPDFLRTTIGSMTTIRGYRTRLVSGFGLVVGLNGTGSADVPPTLRQRLINEMAAQGVGRESIPGPLSRVSPQRLLASEDTAVVMVEGIIPPGAFKGSSFDIVVSALPQTQTSSLEGGRLYTTELRVRGAQLAGPASRTIATAGGDVFTNPFAGNPGDDPSTRIDDPRLGQVLGGGFVVEDLPLGLVLNQPSYARSRMIADRINSRFHQTTADREPMAVAKSDQYIDLNVLKRFERDPKRMLELISALFLNPTDQFNQGRAVEFMRMLDDPTQHQYAVQIALALEAMGKRVLPILRPYYDDANATRQMVALDAGARLGDLGTAEHLEAIARAGEPGRAERATALLGKLILDRPDNFRLAVMLRNLLDSDDALVRLTAFDGLSNVDDATVTRRYFDDRLELALVRSNKPMIYVTRKASPRIVVFDQSLGFDPPLLYTHGANDNLMMRWQANDPTLSVYYRAPGQTRGQTEEIAPAVGNLVYLLAHRPTDRQPKGFGMTYSQVASVLHGLSKKKAIGAPMVLQPTDLMQQIAMQRAAAVTGVEPGDERPETDNHQNGRPESSE